MIKYLRQKHNIKLNQQDKARYECEECGTVFRSEDTEHECFHKSTGAYKVSPEKRKCPFCGADAEEWSRLVVLPKFIRPKERAQYDELREIRLEFIEDSLERIKTNENQYVGFPRTKTQNCVSGSVAIKPQIDWELFDKWVEEHKNCLHSTPVPEEI